jgi:uncharacterized spore protein YtfJ
MLEKLVSGLLSELGKISKSDAVAGNVRDAGKAKVMPLCRVSIGFGTGAGELGGKHTTEEKLRKAGLEGGGAGGALTVEPKAFVVVGPDGIPHMLVLNGRKTVVRRGVDLLQDGTLRPDPPAVAVSGKRSAELPAKAAGASPAHTASGAATSSKKG